MQQRCRFDFFFWLLHGVIHVTAIQPPRQTVGVVCIPTTFLFSLHWTRINSYRGFQDAGNHDKDNNKKLNSSCNSCMKLWWAHRSIAFFRVFSISFPLLGKYCNQQLLVYANGLSQYWLIWHHDFSSKEHKKGRKTYITLQVRIHTHHLLHVKLHTVWCCHCHSAAAPQIQIHSITSLNRNATACPVSLQNSFILCFHDGIKVINVVTCSISVNKLEKKCSW